jgi:hypothetical protein
MSRSGCSHPVVSPSLWLDRYEPFGLTRRGRLLTRVASRRLSAGAADARGIVRLNKTAPERYLVSELVGLVYRDCQPVQVRRSNGIGDCRRTQNGCSNEKPGPGSLDVCWRSGKRRHPALLVPLNQSITCSRKVTAASRDRSLPLAALDIR